jgi:hypothetical protein
VSTPGSKKWEKQPGTRLAGTGGALAMLRKSFPIIDVRITQVKGESELALGRFSRLLDGLRFKSYPSESCAHRPRH